MARKIKPLPKFLLIVIVVLGVGYVAWHYIPKKGGGISIAKKELPPGAAKGTPILNIGVVTWGGYAGGQYFNNGFEASIESRFYKEFQLCVNFIILDDFIVSREAFKADSVDLLWVTVDAFPTEVQNLPGNPIFLFQADWSRGGDAIVVQRNIKSVNDLKDKKVAVAFGTPSHSFLLWILKAAGMSNSDINIVEVPSAIDAASTFKSGAVDAAVVWSPDDKDCVDKVPGAKILKNTKQASHIIADGFLVKKDFLKDNRNTLKSLIKGWLIGASEINNNKSAKKKAIRILAKGLNISKALAKNAINNVRLTTYGDNLDFFGINPNYKGVKGEELYNQMTVEYTKIGFIKGTVPHWRSVTDTSVIQEVMLSGSGHAAESGFKFDKPSKALKTADAFAVKKVTINFPGNSAKLTENAKRIIDLEIGPIAKSFAHSRIRIEGNTASVKKSKGVSGVAFSKKRANAVKKYLVKQYSFAPNRFIIIGNGNSKPVASNKTEKGRAKNRRTDFVILN
jgi:NitT/TauT family transport system substrate-binding protein